LYFTAEILIRFLAFAVKKDCCKDAWFVFDFCLVAMMVVETWILNAVVLLAGLDTESGMGNASILRVVRLLRLTRMARMVRIVRAMPELMVMVKGINVAARSVLLTLILLTIVMYVFAIAFVQLTEGTELAASHFPSVTAGMVTLLLQGTIVDFGDVVYALADVNGVYGIIMVFFIFLSTFTILNMLVGILVEVVTVVSSVEKELMTVHFVKSKLLALMELDEVDEAGENRQIDRAQFMGLLLQQEGAQIIQEVGVDVVGLVDFADHIFEDGRQLSFAEVMEIVLQLRSTNTATVGDVVELRKYMGHMLGETTEYIHDTVTSKVKELEHAVDEMLQKLAGGDYMYASGLDDGNNRGDEPTNNRGDEPTNISHHVS